MIHDKLLIIVFCLVCINGAPIVARHLFKTRFNYPIDFHHHAWDGNRLLGDSKTIRGLLFACLAGLILSPLIGVDWSIGFIFGLMAMFGDILASFTKRRFGLHSGESVLGLDQLPEAFLPLLIIRPILDMSWLQIIIIALAFLVAELYISPILYRLKIRRRPR